VTVSLADDGGIQYAAAYALAMNAATSNIASYQATSNKGHVYVRGKFTPEQAQAIREVVGAVPGVQAVSVSG
jgi:osmotically-inducible protein OsmY